MSRVEDEWAIEKLVRLYTVLNDAGDFDALEPLFTPDAVFARPSSPDVEVRGRSEIIAMFKARPKRTARHILCNTIVRWQDDDTALVHSYTILISSAEAGVATLSVGAFDDEVVRVAGRWLFKARRGSMAFDTITFGTPPA